MPDSSFTPSLPLILARELASNLATPMFLLDHDGMLVYFNDAAELLIGKPFAELGEIDALEFGAVLELSELDGAPMRRRDSPAGIAFFERRPSHQQLLATGYDGVRRRGRGDRVPAVRRGRRDARRRHRVLGRRADRRVPADARPGLGLPGLARRARRGHGSLRRQHLVRRGAPRERARRSCSTPAPGCARSAPRSTRRRGPSCTSSSRTCTSITCRGSGSSARCSSPELDVHIWGPPSPVQTLAERIAIYLSPPLFPVRLADVPAQRHLPRRRRGAASRSARRWCGPAEVTHQGPTVGYRIEEGGRSLAYLPDHEPALGGSLAAQPDHG